MESNPNKQFVHLNCHSDYSLFQSTTRITELVDKAASLGMPGLALTDIGNMYGTIEFYKACKKAGINPIIGTEALVASGTVLRRLILLARNYEGYRNLMHLYDGTNEIDAWGISKIDSDKITTNAKNLMCIIPCNEVEPATLKPELKKLSNTFDAGCLFLGIEDRGLPEDKPALQAIIALGKETGLPLVALNNVRYLANSDAEAQGFLHAIGRRKTSTQSQCPPVVGTEHWFKTAEEMAVQFSFIPEAVANTLVINDMVKLELNLDGPQAPAHIISEDTGNSAEYLRRLVMEAITERYPSVSTAIMARVEHELDIITRCGYEDYFLMFRELVTWAKHDDIPVGPGRGTAASSIVNYILRITDIEPIRFGLHFERFINTQKTDYPYICLD